MYAEVYRSADPYCKIAQSLCKKPYATLNPKPFRAKQGCCGAAKSVRKKALKPQKTLNPKTLNPKT